MGRISYNQLLCSVLEFINNSWDGFKKSECSKQSYFVYGNNKIFRTYCCGEIETIGCYIILRGIRYKVEYNIHDCKVSLSTDGSIMRYVSDYSFSYQKKIYDAIYKQVIAPLIEFHQ